MKALVGGRALVGPELRPIDDAIVLIDGETIVSAGPRDAGKILDDADPEDVAGLTLIPGFIDAHVHIGFVEPLEVVAGGVTTARDLGWPPERIWPLVEASKAPDDAGPTLIAAGPMLTVEGGYPTRADWAPEGTGLVVRGREEAVVAVDAVAAAGAAVIKVALNDAVGPTLDRPTLRAITAAAHGRGLKVTAHVDGLRELDKAIECGVNELAHMLMGADPIPPGTLAGMVEGGMVVVPTLAIRSGREMDVAIDNLARFRDAGGAIVYGTDLGNAGPRPGIDPAEVKAMRAAGMSARAIMLSATTRAAKWLGLPRKGHLSAGADADVIAVDGDPHRDASPLPEVRRVWRMGREVARAS